jgi:DNA anti-recombination protein RmuC
MKPSEEYNNISLETGQMVSSRDISKPVGFSNPEIHENNSLNKVRDILIGSQMRELDKKFARLEERLVKECSDLRDETRKRLDTLENFIKEEADSLSSRTKNEQVKRDEAVKAINEEQRKLAESLEKKMAEIDEEANKTQRELRQQIFSQSQSLHDDIRQKYEEIVALLERETYELRSEKTDRNQLAALFSELALRLNSQ